MPLQPIFNPLAYARLAAERLRRVNRVKPALRSQKQGGADLKGKDERAAQDQAERHDKLDVKL